MSRNRHFHQHLFFQERPFQFFFSFYFLMTPVSIAVFLTASETFFTKPSSNMLGSILPFAGFLTQAANAFAAAIFISLLMIFALASKAPLKTAGKAKELFIWFGKSLLPVPTTAAPASFASSGMISGMGFAIANIIGFC